MTGHSQYRLWCHYSARWSHMALWPTSSAKSASPMACFRFYAVLGCFICHAADSDLETGLVQNAIRTMSGHWKGKLPTPRTHGSRRDCGANATSYLK